MGLVRRLRLCAFAALAVLLAPVAQAECVYLPFRTAATAAPADVGRVYLDGRWYRDFRWGLWPGQRDTVFACGRPEQLVSMRYMRAGVETPDAIVLDSDTGAVVPEPHPLALFDTPTERALKFIAEKCRTGCGFDVNTDGLINDADRAVLELVVQGKLK